MRPSIPVYRDEYECGLAPAIQAQTSFAYLVPISPMIDEDAVAVKVLASTSMDSVNTEVDHYDQFFLKDILVSVGWNKNDDIFDKVEVWAARHTSEDKPFNFEHNQNDIIGHIIASQAVDDEMIALGDDLTVEDLPDKFHIMNGSVIYRNTGDDDRQALIERTIAEIKKGEWFVSMECFIQGFDYGVIQPDGTNIVVARNQETAWLTKYLRAYPPAPNTLRTDKYLGSGIYYDKATAQEYRIGRIGRNLTFCGKGLVRNPANPESIIFNCHVPPVYNKVVNSIHKETFDMADDTKTELQVANEALVALRAELDSYRTKDLDTKLAAALVDLKTKDDQIAVQATQITTLTEASETLAQRVEAAETALAEAQKALDLAAAEKLQASRIDMVVAKGADAAVAAKLVANLASLNDELFASTLETVAPSFVSAKSKLSETEVIDNAVPEKEAALASTATPNTSAVSEFLSAYVLKSPSKTEK